MTPSGSLLNDRLEPGVGKRACVCVARRSTRTEPTTLSSNGVTEDSHKADKEKARTNPSRSCHRGSTLFHFTFKSKKKTNLQPCPTTKNQQDQQDPKMHA